MADLCSRPLNIVLGAILAFWLLLKNSAYNSSSMEKVLCNS